MCCTVQCAVWQRLLLLIINAYTRYAGIKRKGPPDVSAVENTRQVSKAAQKIQEASSVSVPSKDPPRIEAPSQSWNASAVRERVSLGTPLSGARLNFYTGRSAVGMLVGTLAVQLIVNGLPPGFLTSVIMWYD